MRLELAIIQGDKTLSAVILAKNLAGARIQAVFHQPVDAANPGLALDKLHSDCEKSGYKQAWHGSVNLCLAAENGIFHDFRLPTASPRTARKSLPLLLESEFPFNPEDFAWRAVYSRSPDKKNIDALVTLVPQKTLSIWQNALFERGLADIRIFLYPWPMLACLPKLRQNSLFICIFQNNGILCAFNSHGRPMRIQQFFLENDLSRDGTAREIRQKCRLLMNGKTFEPKRVLLYAPGMSMSGDLEKQFELPVITPGEDFPLAGRFNILDENDPGRLAAIAMSGQYLFSRTVIPSFRYKNSANLLNLDGKKAWIPIAAASILLLGCGIVFLLEALDVKSKAAHLRALMETELRKALPDAPKNASTGRLRAILNSRIKELENQNVTISPQIVLKLLEDIHERTPIGLDIDVHRFGMDESHVRIYGRAGNYEEVNALKEAFGKIEGVNGIRIVNAATRAERERGGRSYVEFELDMARDKK